MMTWIRGTAWPVFLILAAVVLVSPTKAMESECFAWNGLKFFRVPAGEFMMGANVAAGKEVGFKDERPRHMVKVPSFCMMQSTLNASQAGELRALLKIAKPADDYDEPNIVTWTMAIKISDGLSKHLGKRIRLPTEAEWEFAARGGLDSKQFPWGDIEDTFQGTNVRDIVLKTRKDCKVKSIEPTILQTILKGCVPAKMTVEQKSTPLMEFSCVAKMINQRVPVDVPNSYGLLNLMNNEWEWTSSRYMPYPYNPKDGREDSNIKLKQELRVLRGGGNENTETCQGYTSLRGYGSAGKQYQSSYQVRFVLEEPN
jgi:formylglycine-generating enzyme required for sulfatase activity